MKRPGSPFSSRRAPSCPQELRKRGAPALAAAEAEAQAEPPVKGRSRRELLMISIILTRRIT